MNLLSLITENKKPNSCGILLYYKNENGLNFMLAHPGGPYYEGLDNGSWSIPKGINELEQSDIECAKREFKEETGMELPSGKFIDLGKLNSKHKTFHIFGLELKDKETYDKVKNGKYSGKSNTFELHGEDYLEIDEVMFFDEDTARLKINPTLETFIDRLTR